MHNSFYGNFRFKDDYEAYLGNLTIYPDLDGSFTGMLSIKNISSDRGDILEKKVGPGEMIYGKLLDKTNVTLIIHRTNTFFVNQIYTFAILLKIVLFNEFLDKNKENEFEFEELIINFTNLNNFFGYGILLDNSNIDKQSISVKINSNIYLEFFYSTSIFKNDNKNYLLYVKIKIINSKSFRDLLDCIYKLQNFFNFFYWAEISVGSIHGIIKNGKIIKIFYNFNIPRKMRKVGPSAFTFEDLFFRQNENKEEQFILSTILNKWFNLYNNDKKSIFLDYFFAVMYDRGSRIDAIFLTLCGLLESYYEYNFKCSDVKKRQSKEQLYNELKPLLKKLPEHEFLPNLKSHIGNFKRTSFQEMLREILETVLYIAPLWSNIIRYCNTNIIEAKLTMYKTENIVKEYVKDILLKSKDIHDTTSVYIKNLKINCLRDNVYLCKKIRLELLNFLKSLYKDVFPYEIKEFRNEFAHGEFSLRKNKGSEEYLKKIFLLTENMYFVSQVLILHELEYSEEKIKEVYNLSKPNFNIYNLFLGVNI